MRILIISDIHGNYPALEAVARQFRPESFDHVINCGDSLVYAPFPNETLDWLRTHKVISILGNTDKKVIKLLQGDSFKKPSKPDKRIMYTSTAGNLTEENSSYLQSFAKSSVLVLPGPQADGDPRRNQLGIFHGSPEKHHEFLFSTTSHARFRELARKHPYRVVATGHSHTPYHFHVERTAFINPGSVGRMFDGDPAASCAVLELTGTEVTVGLHRVPYSLDNLLAEIRRAKLPSIYQEMYLKARKLN